MRFRALPFISPAACLLVIPIVAAAQDKGSAKDPAAIAKLILDPKRPDAERDAAAKAHPDLAPEIITHMTRDIAVGTPAEYERIPWIWRVAVACGRQNDAGQLKRLLDVSLPRDGEPLRDWQAVVVGGGVIIGVSQAGQWPAVRVPEVIGGDEGLLKRWRRALDLASVMSDDEKVPPPTRYDALRLLAAEPWEKRGKQITRYLARGTHQEIQSGAVAAAADVDSPDAVIALVESLPGLTAQNRDAALDGLLRTPERGMALLDAIEAGKLRPESIGPERAQRLRTHPDQTLARRATRLLPKA